MAAIEERANGNSYTQRFVHIFAIVSHRPALQILFAGHLSDHFYSPSTILANNFYRFAAKSWKAVERCSMNRNDESPLLP